MTTINVMLLAAVATASLIVSMFFIRFWQRTRDRFFALFAVAFAIDAVDRIALAMYWGSETDNPVYFLLRFLAYGIIIVAIIDKNSGSKSDT